MGGNVVITDTLTNEKFYAEKIPLRTIGRENFIKTVNGFLSDFNEMFSKTGQTLWSPEDIESGLIFNGSTGFIMNPNYDSEEVEAAKPFVGDIDVVIDKDLKLNVYNFLNTVKGKSINSDVKYLGNNKPEYKPLMSQINCIFEMTFNVSNIGEIKVNVQIDFEFADFIGGKPSEWSRFGHSSNLKDAKKGIKAFHHKYLLRSLIGCLFTDKNGVVTANGTELSKPARVKVFDVDLGLCDHLLKGDVRPDGKTSYTELQKDQYTCIKDLRQIFKLCFNNEPDDADLKKLWSFTGLCELIEKYVPTDILPDIHRRYADLLWASSPERTQELERNNPGLDLEVKLKGYQYFIDIFGLPDLHTAMIDPYYKCFGLRKRNFLAESFREFIALKNYVQEDF